MSIVIDTSAVMAVILEEAGAQMVLPHLRGGLFCSVNLSEAISRIAEKKEISAVKVLESLRRFELDIRLFDTKLALIAAEFRPLTRKKGISLADRACLALAACEKLPVLTADSDWAALGLDLDIRLIR